MLTAKDVLPNEELYPAKILLDASVELEFLSLELSLHQNSLVCNNYRFINFSKLINSINQSLQLFWGLKWQIMDLHLLFLNDLFLENYLVILQGRLNLTLLFFKCELSYLNFEYC